MGKLSIIILLLLILVNCLSVEIGKGTDIYRQSKLIYTNSNGEEGITVYLYNKNNELYKSVWSLKDESRYSENIYQYNEDGQLVGFYREFSDGLKTEELYTYAGDRLVKEYYNASNGRKGYIEYVYNNHGIRSEAHCRGYKGWLTCDIKYVYDNGILISAEIISENEKAGLIKYTYNETGELVDEKWDFNSKWSQLFHYEYEVIDTKNQLLANPFYSNGINYKLMKEEYYYSNNISRKTYFEYTDSDELKMMKQFYSDGKIADTEFFYKNGNIIKSIKHSVDKDDIEFRFQYNECGQLIQKSAYNMKNELLCYEIYNYDKNGILYSAVFYNSDFWLTGHVEYIHDKYDHIIGAKFKGNGLSADVHYGYNKQNMLMEAVWEFSNGDKEVYTLFYENTEKLKK